MKAARFMAAFFLMAFCALCQTQWRQSPGYAAYQKGNSLFIAQKFTESMAALEEALRLDPKLVPALTLKAKIAMANSRYDVARESLERALAVDPSSAYTEFLYGLNAYIANDLQLALPRFEQAHRLDAADPRAVLYLGLTAEALGRNGQALTWYEEAVRLEARAGSPQAATFLAGSRLLLLMGREEDSGLWIGRALKADPASRDAHFESARLLLLKGNAAAAVTECNTALKLQGGDTTDTQIHYLLIRAYRESGDSAEAARQADMLRLLDDKAPR